MNWFCGQCGTQLIYVREEWVCPQCGEYTNKDTKDEICDSYVEGFKNGYNRAHDDMSEGIQR